MNRLACKRMAMVLALICGVALMAIRVHSQTTSFTYQGRLTDGGVPANASYDLQFALFDSLSGGAASADHNFATSELGAD